MEGIFNRVKDKTIVITKLYLIGYDKYLINIYYSLLIFNLFSVTFSFFAVNSICKQCIILPIVVCP